MDYIVKRAAERVQAFREMQTADWWGELSMEGQAEYLKEHPDSKKAQEIHEQRKQAQLKRPSVKSHEDALEKEDHPDMVKHADDHPENIEHMHPDAQKFFKDGHDKPGSPERKAAASFFAKKAKQIAKSVAKHAKANVKEWKHGVVGIGKLIHGKKLSDNEKEGVKTVIKDVLITAGVVMIGGGLAHGVAAAMAHMGRDLLAETFFKTVAHGIIEHGAEVASTASPEAIAFMALVHEVIAESESEEETAAGGGKFPPKKGKDKKNGKSKKNKPKAAKPVSKSSDEEDDDSEEDDESGAPPKSKAKNKDSDGDEDESSASGMEADEDSESDDVSSEDEGELDPENAEAVEKVVQFLAKFAEDGKIPKEAWLAAANEQPMEDGKVFPDQEPAADDEDSNDPNSEEASEDDESGDVNDDEDEDSGDGSTVEDKVKQKDPDEAPKNPKLKKGDDDDDESEEEDEDEDGDAAPPKKSSKVKKSDEFNSADEGNDSE